MGSPRSRIRRFLGFVAVLCALLGVSAAVADNPVVIPGSADPASIEARIKDQEARKARVDAEVEGLGARRSSANERLATRTRTLYRISHAGFAPMAGGFNAMLDHVSRVERMKRLVRTELASLEHLESHGAALRAESERLSMQLAADKTLLGSAMQRQVEVQEEARMQDLFSDAFARPGAGQGGAASNGTLHTEYGTIRVHDDEGPKDSFESQRGQLTLPLAGAREVREAQREDGMGVEFLGSPGAGVRAAAEGTVAFAGKHPAYGELVIVDHGNRYFTVYGGLGNLSVREGDAVSRGARLGQLVSGALYIEVRRGTKSLDARAWLGV